MRQSGFAYIAAVVLLVVVAGISVALLRLSATQQQTVNQNLLGVRASMAARGGMEWGLYQLRANACFGDQTLTDFMADTGFRVRVRCSVRSFSEGESAPGAPIAKNAYRIEAVACNAASCPAPTGADVVRPDYVERRRVATVCMTATGDGC
ncbi:MSHA biogenesis protein MshP [Massilia agri]|uniref:MSHA biogenesis protein MshP n=1 Tax=Massilia agri TaxID=1886785 RepID=A0ABT2AJL5_9BURK|nr:MSHA biogenesis protein MshP [Massilia agri]MCS0596375.1 MSHA biogenesis protein MshP [Massilia agri]